GMALTDIGNAAFDGNADPQTSNMSTGLALTYKLPGLSTTFAYDYKHMLDSGDWKKKNHAGLEVALPFISVYGGMNQAYFTYGFSLDIWLFRLTALSYAEEQGAYALQDPERRYLLRLALKVGL
ncbi:MAG: hypothetical protein AABZ06_03010, partial [Bdellovibrionota bacterium]